jgi:hypothetical protein
LPLVAGIVSSCVAPQQEVRDEPPAVHQAHLEMTLHRLLEAAAPQILDCFHAGAHFDGISIAAIDASGRVAVAEGKLAMRVLFRDFTMGIRVEIDLAKRTIRVVPGESTTPFAPDPRCVLGESRRMSAVLGTASRDALRELERVSPRNW